MSKIMKFAAACISLLAIIILCSKIISPTTSPNSDSLNSVAVETSASRPVHVRVPQETVETSSAENQNSSAPLKPLSPTETQKLGNWMRERGYLFDLSQGATSGRPSASGYDAMDDATLKQQATAGDRTAALTLGTRILNRRNAADHPLPPQSDIDEATELLTQATILGYTASITELAELARKQAQFSRELRPGERFVATDMIKAYAYAYLLQKRGDINANVTLQMITQTGILSSDQDIKARRAAEETYINLNQKRQALGYPAFEDGLPPDIKLLTERMVALNMEKK